MNLTHFCPKMYGKFGKKTTPQSTSDLLTKHQTSEISLNTSNLMLKRQKWQHCMCHYKDSAIQAGTAYRGIIA